MRTFFPLALLMTVLVFQSCREEEEQKLLPIYEVADVSLPDLADNEIDQRRICLAEVLAQMLTEEDFRQYLRQRSIKAGENWNEEFLIVQHLDELVTTDMTFLDVVEQAIVRQESGCFTTVAAFRDAILQDPMLVLKLPDMIPAEEWDATRTVPFLYVKTLTIVEYPTTEEDLLGQLGIHPSGAVDIYRFGQPNYFPLVLKYSEDWVAINENLSLESGIDIRNFQTNIPPAASSATFFETLATIPTTNFYLIRLNDLLNHIHAARTEVFEPNPVVPCSDDCSLDCVRLQDRRLLATGLGIDNRNELALEYNFTTYFRSAGQPLFSENLLPLILGRQLSQENTYDWQRYLLGSHRMTDLFDASFTHTIDYVSFRVNGTNTELPAFSNTTVVSGLRQIALPNLVLAENIIEGDWFRYATYRITLDALAFSLIGVDDNPIFGYDIPSGIVQNYNLYCEEPESLGFNSVALFTTY